eukprot:6172585-Pleurochrysis_carterae.AAC.8
MSLVLEGKLHKSRHIRRRSHEEHATLGLHAQAHIRGAATVAAHVNNYCVGSPDKLQRAMARACILFVLLVPATAWEWTRTGAQSRAVKGRHGALKVDAYNSVACCHSYLH